MFSPIQLAQANAYNALTRLANGAIDPKSSMDDAASLETSLTRNEQDEVYIDLIYGVLATVQSDSLDYLKKHADFTEKQSRTSAD